MLPKVSVIVPVFNTDAYLERCLDTLVFQTLEEIEIIIVNDGSTDNSQSIIDRYVAQYPEKVIHVLKENGGLSDARNVGVGYAAGEYLAFVDSDDWVDLDMYDRLYSRAVQKDADVVSHPMTYSKPGKRNRRYFTSGLDYFGKPVSESPELLSYANSFAVNKIFRRSFWNDSDFLFPVGQAFEDSAIVYNILYLANKVEVVNIPFYVYERTREESITNRSDRRVFDILKSCDSILNFYRSKTEYPRMKDTVELLCIGHIFVRFDLLSRSTNRKLGREFIREAYAYLNQRIPGWRESSFFERRKDLRLRSALKRQIRRRPTLAKLWYTAPLFIRKTPGKLFRFSRLFRSAISKRIKATRLNPRSVPPKHVSENTHQQRIQEVGCRLIVGVQEVLRREGIAAFADFGTLLGLVREGALLAHDLDIDLGVVIRDPREVAKSRIALERFGFRVWREYYKGSELVESSFKMLGVKIDLHYYHVNDETAKTWLFYRDPEKTYGQHERDIVEMTYSPINELTTLEVEGLQVQVPSNAEQLLEQKYGPNWTTPDKNWVYWRSPAATPIAENGHFILYKYADGFAYAGDARDQEIHARLGLSQSDKAK
jgi:glycosyltransferase involved in cell wall biosynthesis